MLGNDTYEFMCLIENENSKLGQCPNECCEFGSPSLIKPIDSSFNSVIVMTEEFTEPSDGFYLDSEAAQTHFTKSNKGNSSDFR